MTKKRIADLLKEEVEKTTGSSSSDAATKTTSTRKSTTAKSANKSTSRTSKTSLPKTASAHKTKTAATAKTTRTATTKTTPSSTRNKAQPTAALEKKVAELETALKASQKQVAGLQEDLETHQGRIYELKDSLESAERSATAKDKKLTKVTKELEDAKDMIRKLTESASKPAESQPAEPKHSHPVLGADLATNRHTLSVRQQRTSRKAIPEYAIQRGEQNSMLSDDDIGWVD